MTFYLLPSGGPPTAVKRRRHWWASLWPTLQTIYSAASAWHFFKSANSTAGHRWIPGRNTLHSKVSNCSAIHISAKPCNYPRTCISTSSAMLQLLESEKVNNVLRLFSIWKFHAISVVLLQSLSSHQMESFIFIYHNAMLANCPQSGYFKC